VIEQSRDTPVFYIQYGHACGKSPLIKRLGQYPRVVEAAALAHEPHRIAFHLYELATKFHRPLDARQSRATFALYYS
jgi:arginyl-tRNA synthetase